MGLAACIDEVLLPAMRQIGVWWAVGHCDIVQERLATEAIRTWLDRRSALAPAPTRAAPDPAGLRTQRSAHRRSGINGSCCCDTRDGRAGYLAPERRPPRSRRPHGPPRSPVSSWCPIWRPGDAAPSNRSARSTIWVSPCSTPGTRSPPPRSRRGVPGHYLGGCIEDALRAADRGTGAHRPRVGGRPSDLTGWRWSFPNYASCSGNYWNSAEHGILDTVGVRSGRRTVVPTTIDRSWPDNPEPPVSAPLPAKRGHGSPTPSIAGVPADDRADPKLCKLPGGRPRARSAGQSDRQGLPKALLRSGACWLEGARGVGGCAVCRGRRTHLPGRAG